MIKLAIVAYYSTIVQITFTYHQHYSVPNTSLSNALICSFVYRNVTHTKHCQIQGELWDPVFHFVRKFSECSENAYA